MKTQQSFLVALAWLLSLAWVGTAAAEERNFWRYGRGYVENTDGKEWVQKHDNKTFRYVEVQRNGKFVELYDKSRDHTMHLYEDCAWHKGADKVWKKGSDGGWVNLPAVKERNYWRHGKGHFENTTGNTWVEKIDDKTFRFVEVERTDKRIELYDKGRDYTIHLYAGDCWGKPSGEAWKKLYTGKWGK
jgi:hypothetical protein